MQHHIAGIAFILYLFLVESGFRKSLDPNPQFPEGRILNRSKDLDPSKIGIFGSGFFSEGQILGSDLNLVFLRDRI